MVLCSSLGQEQVWVAQVGAEDTQGAELVIFHGFAGKDVSDVAQGNQPWLRGAGAGGLSRDPLSCPPRLSCWRATTGNAASRW